MVKLKNKNQLNPISVKQNATITKNHVCCIWIFMYASIYSYDSNMYLFINFFYLSNKTTSFCLQLHADMVQLTNQIKIFMEITE